MKKIFVFCSLLLVSTCCFAQEAVDLGLSVKWSTINVGANNPRDCGYYYAWGEVNSKDSYTKENYKIPPRYNQYQAARDISGTNSDVARVQWKNYWRIPTEYEFRELLACKWELKIDDEGYYYTVTGPSGKSIILPLERYMKGKGKYAYNECYYWSSNSFYDANYEASALLVMFRDLYNRNEKPRMDALHYYYGAFVRPVQPYWKNEVRYTKQSEPVLSKEEQDDKSVEKSNRESNRPYFSGDVTVDNVHKALESVHKICDAADASEKDKAIALYKEAYTIYKKLESFPAISDYIHPESLKLYKIHIENGLKDRGVIINESTEQTNNKPFVQSSDDVMKYLNQAADYCDAARAANDKKEIISFYQKAYDIYKKLETDPDTAKYFPSVDVITQGKTYIEQELIKRGVKL